MTYTPLEFLELADEVLEIIGLNSKNALMLLLSTCAQESRLGEYNRQIGMKGKKGAFGIMQIEFETYNLIYDNFLDDIDNKDLKDSVLSLCDENLDEDENLQYNDAYSIAVARCLYRSIQKPLPPYSDIQLQAYYWKEYYNRGGKGTVKQFINSYKTLVEPYL